MILIFNLIGNIKINEFAGKFLVNPVNISVRLWCNHSPVGKKDILWGNITVDKREGSQGFQTMTQLDKKNNCFSFR